MLIIILFRKERKRVFVYNYGSSVVNVISLLKLKDLSLDRGIDFPSIKMIAPYFIYATKSMTLFIIANILFHLIPAIFADIALLATRRKPM